MEAVELACDLSAGASGLRHSFPEVCRTWNLHGSPSTWQPVDDEYFRLEVGPAVLRVRRMSAKEVETAPVAGSGGERAQRDEEARCEAAGEVLAPLPGREITTWSGKSRRRMMYRLATLDFTEMPGVPEMITLTYPGDLDVTTLDGRLVKAHLAAFRRRWLRRWGSQPVGAWKLEFQPRTFAREDATKGAPHFHLYLGRPLVDTSPPGPGSATGTKLASLDEFRQWLSQTWYEIVGSGDERHLRVGTGLDREFCARARDPKRLSVYFTKHNLKGAGKAAQNEPPEWFGHVGRFWGVWGLRPHVEEVEITELDYMALRRVLRAKRRHPVRERRDRNGRRYLSGVARVPVSRASASTGEVRTRWVNRRNGVRRAGGRDGLFVLVQNGPKVAVQLGRWLRGDLKFRPPPAPPIGQGRNRATAALLG